MKYEKCIIKNRQNEKYSLHNFTNFFPADRKKELKNRQNHLFTIMRIDNFWGEKYLIAKFNFVTVCKKGCVSTSFTL